MDCPPKKMAVVRCMDCPPKKMAVVRGGSCERWPLCGGGR